jgi:TorA maturation chaperone TorD
LARFRQIAYRLFGSLFLYPDEARLATLMEVARELLSQSEPLAAFPFFGRWRRLLATLTTADGRSLTTIVPQKYVRLFRANSDGALCLPYESFYLDPQRKAAGWIAAQLEREYAAAGLALSPFLRELPDHVAVELEFMAFLCGREAEAWEEEALEKGLRVLERQRTFLGEHLGRWFPAFTRQVAVADQGGLYAVAAEAAAAFVHHDRDLVALLLEQVAGST